MALNIELFKKIRDRIAEIPESYNQNDWIQESLTAPCGTAACLAGEAIICNSVNIKGGIRRLKKLADVEAPEGCDVNPQGYDSMVPIRAAKALGLTPQQMDIFDSRAEGWPEPFRSEFKNIGTNQGRAKVAVAFLDHIISTGSVL